MFIDISCLVSTVCFIISDSLSVVTYVQSSPRNHFNYTALQELDPTYIEQQWKLRNESRQIELAGSLFNVAAWFSLTIPILQVAWVLSNGGKRMIACHFAIGSLALLGSVMQTVALLVFVGCANIAEWLSSGFNLNNWIGPNSNDQIGWRTLEVAYMISSGVFLWLDAIQELALFGILTCLFASSRTHKARLFNPCWAWLGAVVAVLSLVGFGAAVMRFQSWRKFAFIAVAISSFNQFVLLPIWLLTLGRQLPRAFEKFSAAEWPDKNLQEDLVLQPTVDANNEDILT
jgi:hypothetical protein